MILYLVRRTQSPRSRAIGDEIAVSLELAQMVGQVDIERPGLN
jgi:hypothetical protein